MIAALACVLLTLTIAAYVFYPEKQVAVQGDKPRLELLAERKTALYASLRDLSFEHRAGKYSDQEYEEQRAGLEAEAAEVLTELEALAALEPSRSADRAPCGTAPAPKPSGPASR